MADKKDDDKDRDEKREQGKGFLRAMMSPDENGHTDAADKMEGYQRASSFMAELAATGKGSATVPGSEGYARGGKVLRSKPSVFYKK